MVEGGTKEQKTVFYTALYHTLIHPNILQDINVHQEARNRWNDDLGRIMVEGGTKEQKTVFYTALYHTLIHPNILQDINDQYPSMESDEILSTKGDRYTVFSLWDTYRNLHQLMTLVYPERQIEMVNQYPSMESDEILSTKGDRYTVFSLWDTYRNLHQLMTLVYPERQIEMVKTMLDMYREHGWLPKWELYGRETLTMEGDPSLPVIVDTWMKGLRDFDINLAYEAMYKSATMPGKDNLMRPDNDDYISKGYVPLMEQFDNSVSHALEYYIADYALSILAKELGKKDDAKMFYKRAMGYKNYYCKEYGTLRPILPNGELDYALSILAKELGKKDDAKMFYKRAMGYKNYYCKEYGTLRPILPNGEFYSPFDPMQGENFEPSPGFHEGNAWNYTYYVPHDVKGLAKLMGGEKKFVDKLQMIFDKGYYDPANEPDIAYPYLFSYFKGEEWRTQKTVKKLLEKYFKPTPDGIPGNDDAGTMSAWAIFSMMGFYPDCPGVPEYTLTEPTFDKITISLNPKFYKRKQLIIEVVDDEKNTDGYIKRIEMGDSSCGYRVNHNSLVESGSLRFYK